MARMGKELSKASARPTLREAFAFARDFASFAGPRGWRATAYVASGAMLEGVGLVLLVPLFGIVIGEESSTGRWRQAVADLFDFLSIHAASGRLVLLLVVFGALILLRNVVIARRNVLLAELQIGFVEAQRSRVMRRLADAGWDQVVRLRHTRITHLMSGDIQRIGSAAHFSLQCAVACLMLLTQTVLAFLLAPLLALLACALLVAGGLALIPMLRRARDLGAQVTNANLTLLNGIAQFLGGLKLALSQNLQSGFVAEFEETLGGLTRRQIAYVRQQTRSRLAFATLSAAAGAAAILIGHGLLGTAPSVLITFLLILARMSGPATQIQQGAQQLTHGLPAYEKLSELEAELRAPPPAPAAAARNLDGAIEFRQVSFHHPAVPDNGGESRGVRDLEVKIRPGEFIGVTGPSGAGKTTFADLLVGLYPPREGRILVGGSPLDGADLAAWRARLGYVSQDPFLFHDTVRRNLSWAKPDASEAEMWEALALAGAGDLVRRLESGLDTVVGERGTLVSGGERQRLALARALLRRPALLVLDEAASAIDVQGERELLQRISALRPRPTIVMIAHRAESLALCERLLRFDEGRLVSDKKTAAAGTV